MPADLASLERLAHEIWNERADLRERFDSIHSLGLWSWLMVEGAREYPAVLEHLPVPPEHLRGRVNDSGEELFLRSGLGDAQNLFERLERAGMDPARGPRILDFGCGCGRVLRIASRLAERCELHGCDIDPDLVEWCDRNLGYATFRVSRPAPPAPYSDESFDAIYSFSIFTHLPERLHREWLDELARLLRPGGALVVTTAGRRTVEKFLQRAVHAELDRPTPEELRADLPRFEAGGYLFYPLETDAHANPQGAREEGLYGMTFFHEGYVRDHWQERFELVAFDEAPSEWQDYVVLRKRG